MNECGPHNTSHVTAYFIAQKKQGNENKWKKQTCVRNECFILEWVGLFLLKNRVGCPPPCKQVNVLQPLKRQTVNPTLKLSVHELLQHQQDVLTAPGTCDRLSVQRGFRDLCSLMYPCRPPHLSQQPGQVCVTHTCLHLCAQPGHGPSQSALRQHQQRGSVRTRAPAGGVAIVGGLGIQG